MTRGRAESAMGYRPYSRRGPRVRTDVVDVYVFRRAGNSAWVEFLQLFRSSEPLAQTWHPVMGHIEGRESAGECALRELKEELGLVPDELWSLEQVHPFYIPAIDTIVLSPRFAARVSRDWKPRLNREHARARWVPQFEIASSFMWPGQQAACREVLMRVNDEAVRGREPRKRRAPKRKRAGP